MWSGRTISSHGDKFGGRSFGPQIHIGQRAFGPEFMMAMSS